MAVGHTCQPLPGLHSPFQAKNSSLKSKLFYSGKLFTASVTSWNSLGHMQSKSGEAHFLIGTLKMHFRKRYTFIYTIVAMLSWLSSLTRFFMLLKSLKKKTHI